MTRLLNNRKTQEVINQDIQIKVLRGILKSTERRLAYYYAMQDSSNNQARHKK